MDGTWCDFLDPLEHRLRCHRAPEREELIETGGTQLARQRGVARKERLDLARKRQPSSVLGHVQGPHTEGIARENQLAAIGVPQTDRPLTVQAPERLGSPLLVGVDNDFRVAARLELMTALDEIAAQLEVVEDFAVERDP